MSKTLGKKLSTDEANKKRTIPVLGSALFYSPANFLLPKMK